MSVAPFRCCVLFHGELCCHCLVFGHCKWVVNGSLLLRVMDVPLNAETLASAAQSVVSSFVRLMGRENS